MRVGEQGDSRSDPCGWRSRLRPPAGAAGQQRCHAARGAARHGPQSGPMRAPRGRYAGAASAEPEQSGTACAAGVAVLARLGGAPPPRTGGADSPNPPQSGGGWAPRSTYAATGAGEEQCKPAPQGRLTWACIAEGLPCATAGGWQAPQVRRPEPPPTLRSSCRRRRLGGGDQPPHAPDCRRQAGRAAAPPPPRVGRGTPRRARGREGRPRLQAGVDGSPLSPVRLMLVILLILACRCGALS